MSKRGSHLTVVSYNIRAAIGPGPFPPAWWRHVDRARLERIATVIEDLRADLVALQEVTLMTVHGEALDMARELSRRTKMEARYGSVHHFAIRDPRWDEAIGAAFWGNAILSRFPIAASRVVALPIPSDEDLVEPTHSGMELAGVRYADAERGAREPRCLLACEIDLDGDASGRLRFCSTHLTYRGSGQRRRQAQRIAEEAATMRGPLVVAGDLNAPLDSRELQPLRAGLADAFAASGIPAGDPRRYSYPGQSIDHVLVRGLRVASCRAALETGDASDHWPVVAELAV